MPVCTSAIDQKNTYQSGKLTVSLSAPSSKSKRTLHNCLAAREANLSNTCIGKISLQKIPQAFWIARQAADVGVSTAASM